MKATSSSSSAEALRRRTWHLFRPAPSCSRARASTVTASDVTPVTSQKAILAPLSVSNPQTRSQSPGRSARVIGPANGEGDRVRP